MLKGVILIFLICIYWCFTQCKESRNINNNNTRWILVNVLNKKLDILPISKKNNKISSP